MGYVVLLIYVIFVVYRIVKINKQMKKTEERIKQHYGTTQEKEAELRKIAEEEKQKRIEFEQKLEEEILELLIGYTDNKIEFNLHSLFNYFDENKVVYSIRPYTPEEYGLDIKLYNYKCNIVCKKIQGFELVRITNLAIIDQKNKGGISYV